MERTRRVACCWCREDIGQAGQRDIVPLVVMQHLHDRAQACSFFAGLPEGAFVYSNTKFTSTAFVPALAVAAAQRRFHPAAVNISDTSGADRARVRAVPRMLCLPMTSAPTPTYT